MWTDIAKAKKIDMNLLLTFEAIYAHKSVSKGAALLGLSPSAVSQSLAKLRVHYSDPLFIREGQRLVATTVADNLHINVSAGFNLLVGSLDELTEVEVKNTFIIYCPHYLAARILPDVWSKIESLGFDCEVVHTSSDEELSSVEDILHYRKADIVFDAKSYYDFSKITEHYLNERIVPICSKEHPRLKGSLSEDDITSEQLTFLNIRTSGVKIQQQIRDFYGDRANPFRSNSIFVTTAIIEKSSLVSFVPEWLAKKMLTAFNIKILECELFPEPVEIYMTYNKSALQNKMFARFLEIVKECKPLD